MSFFEISDDDESFAEIIEEQNDSNLIELSSDDEEVLAAGIAAEDPLTDDELPSIELEAKKSESINRVFTNSGTNFERYKYSKGNNSRKPKINEAKSTKNVNRPNTVKPETPIVPAVSRMIEGVNINLPVNPYGSQVALMSMLIKAIKRSQNCLLESPTGSGKTLALLCGALGWLCAEKNIKNNLITQGDINILEKTSPIKEPPVTPEKLFSKNTFGEKSIYDKPENGSVTNTKRQEPLSSFEEDSPDKSKVQIHKKRKLSGDTSTDPSSLCCPKKISSPQKKSGDPADSDSEKSVQNSFRLLDIREILVNSSVPTIYYGARTHKQLQQVIKEFKRTSYCGQVKMSILSSREYSCIREFDKQMWGTKNEMCRGCIKKITPKDETKRPKDETNCKYYDNRQAINHKRMPPAFDLEDLVNAGHELTSCPYYAAREMAASANIVFCPYNYLIEPSIRSSLRINLQDNILIIDEAHNIEDICRDAATFTFTRDDIAACLKELEVVSNYRYSSANQEVLPYIDKLIKMLKSWDDWFVNQTKLLENATVSNNEAVYSWESDHFAKTLENHNIGVNSYPEFCQCATEFCTKLQNEPRSLVGATQTSGTLLESINTALGYLFIDNCKYMDDFKPALVKVVTGDTNGPNTWRRSQFLKRIETESISLRLICLNPGVVFDSLKTARSIILASGTLTPLISLHSELATEFPLKISPSHVIPSDRVWIGTLITHPDGSTLECKSRDTNQPDTQDSLGEAILWVTRVTPHGVLCFLPSYQVMNKLIQRWQINGIWEKLNAQKHVFQENRNVRDHNDTMDDYYKYVSSDKGALLFAVYRGKVSEGMDFKDHQARAVITVGVPYPNTFDMAVKSKMDYNDKYSRVRNLLTGRQWLTVQAYRALNQAVGRCVRHKDDWGAVLMIDARFQNRTYTEHLSKWVVNFLERNHFTYKDLLTSPNSLETFMQNMKIKENEDI